MAASEGEQGRQEYFIGDDGDGDVPLCGEDCWSVEWSGQRESGPKDTSAGWLASPCSWAAATLATCVAACLVVQPGACSSDPQCSAQHDSVPTHFSAYAASGLVMVLIGETANLITTFKGAKEAQALIPDLRSRCMPSLLLILSFLVLICETGIYAASSHPWFASTRPDLQGPVYTVTFAEWLLNVPMLLVMAGHCALGRPLKELGRPVVVTNIYIVFAWMALLTTSPILRWSLVVATFSMYFWASMDMVRWVAAYLRAAPAELSSRMLRPCLALGLIALFAVYAVVYMSVLCGIMQPRTEQVTFLVLNVGSKLAFSVAFVVIRGNEYHRTLTGVLKKLSTSNVAIVSILRGSFDMLLPCVGDGEGRCSLPLADAGDMKQLEHVLQRSVAGLSLGDLLVDDAERVRFAAYVQNAQRQAEAPEASVAGVQGTGALTAGGALPPVAQVLNCRLAVGSTPGVQPASVGCAVHLSVVPSSASLAPGRQMVAAVRLTEDSEASRPEEAAVPPLFQAFEPGHDEGAAEDHNMSDDKYGDSNGHMVASLLDVAKLGMSTLLRSACSASGDGEVESGYGESFQDDSSYVQPKKPSEATVSGILGRPSRGPSVISEEEEDGEEEELEDSASMPRAKPQLASGPRPQLPSSPRASSASGCTFQRLATLLEPEEERFSRSTTAEKDEREAAQPQVAGPRDEGEGELKSEAKEEEPEKPQEVDSYKEDQQALACRQLPRDFPSVAAAVSAAAQELLGESSEEARVGGKSAEVTVTMRIAPLQFGVAVGTVALAAAVTIFSARRRL